MKSKFDSLPDGFYLLREKVDGLSRVEESLVRLYFNPASKKRGIGFGVWDGMGFLPLSDLSEKANLVPVTLHEKSDFEDMVDRIKSVLNSYRHDKWPSGVCYDTCPGCAFEKGVLAIIDARSKDEMNPMKQMFDMQRQLNLRCGVDTSVMTDEEKGKWVLNYTRALSQETAELVDSVPWKWWAKYQKYDEQNARVEVVDMFHFLISLAQVLGMSAEDVFRIYSEKNKVNHQRQDSGYAVKTEDNKTIA